MQGYYIILIIIGIGCVLASFFLAGKTDVFEKSKETQELSTYSTDTKDLDGTRAIEFSSQIEKMKKSIMEDAERELNRLSNEKIMALDEFSDTVLEKINQNHSEVIFLYSMLNEKEQELKELVSTINQTAKKSKSQDNKAETKIENKGTVGQKPALRKNDKVLETSAETKQNKKKNTVQNKQNELEKVKGAYSRKEVLEMHEKGKSVTEIAKELNVGKGEVKLIIDLYQGAKQ